jgi:hypothetical protein
VYGLLVLRRLDCLLLWGLPQKKLQCKNKTITVQVIEALTSPEVLGKIIAIVSDKISVSIPDSINSSVEASIKALMDEHIIPLEIEAWSSWNIVPGVQDGLLN